MNRVDYLQGYFLQLDEGMGTAYERYALNRFLDNLVRRFNIETVLELPANGVMGVPGIKSMIFALCGCEVTLVHPSADFLSRVKKLWDAMDLEVNLVKANYQKTRLKDSSYDLVWNFCVFEHFQKPYDVISEMTRLSRQLVLLQIQNVFNIGMGMHSLYHHLHQEPWDHGAQKRMDHRRLVDFMEANRLQIIEVGGTDMPPWPDINMKISDVTKKQKVHRAAKPKAGDELRPRVATKPVEKIADMWAKRGPQKFPTWMQSLQLWYLLELLSPQLLKIWLSHHPYAIGLKEVP